MESSFDVTSKIDRMELTNAINQAIREIDTRFDFKNSDSKIELSSEKISISSQTVERAKAVLEVVRDKLVKRGVSLKHLEVGTVQLSGKENRIECKLKEGITTENAKLISELVKEKAPKSVKAQIQGEELRVTSKSRDDLQITIQLIKEGGFDFALQFTNFR